MPRISIMVSCLALLGGCTTNTLYYWGQYENDIYLMYLASDKAAVEVRIETMQTDIEKARSGNKPLPPGFRAHLGFLYSQIGNLIQARELFEAEKKAFPESSKLMDRFIEKLSPQ